MLQSSNISKYSVHSSQIQRILTLWIDFDTLGYIMQHEQDGGGRHRNLDRNDWSAQAGHKALHNGPLGDWRPGLAHTETWLGPKYSQASRGRAAQRYPQLSLWSNHNNPLSLSYRCLPAVPKWAARRAWVHISRNSLVSESQSHADLFTGEAGWPIRPRRADYCLCLGRDSSIFRNFS